MLLVGAGLIGRRHAAAIERSARATLCGVVDPDPRARSWAEAMGAPCFAALGDALEGAGAEAVLVATPNTLHAGNALGAIEKRLPVLVEKPIAATLADARLMVRAAEAAGVPLAVGHHRRHDPILAAAREAIGAGRIGRVVAAHASAWMAKPDDYFDVAWRREPGAGPVLVNLIHDIDALQHLCGPIGEVTALVSNAVRGHAVEDTAAAAVRFASGALGTLGVSDTAVSPWSWELTAAENPAYPATGQLCATITGTRGALSIPDLVEWSQKPGDAWWDPIHTTRRPREAGDALVRQIDQFAAVARGEAEPLASGRDGLLALAVVDAIERSAREGRTVTVDA